MKSSTYGERLLSYPAIWESEYKKDGLVPLWKERFPELFKVMLSNPAHPGRLSSRLGTLDLFAQYALQYLLKDSEGVESITWYKLASQSPAATDRERTVAHWRTMKGKMGVKRFTALQNAIVEDGFRDTSGEPDLFCWTPDGHWFFAEAKRADQLGDKQRRWFRVCRNTLGENVDIRVYRLESAR